jgi:hypothetical protein
LTLAACALFFALPAIADESFEYQGVVLGAGEEQIVLKMGTEDFRFLVSADTKITLDGASAKLEQIEEGFLATIKGERQGDEFIARQVSAKRVKPAMSR